MGFLQPNGRGCRLFRRAPLKPARREPVIIVHSLVQAIAALTATVKVGRAVVLLSAPGAGSYVGPGWFGALVDAARRSEIQGVVFTGRADIARRLADIALQHGVQFATNLPAPTLDLGDDFIASPEVLEQRCADLLT